MRFLRHSRLSGATFNNRRVSPYEAVLREAFLALDPEVQRAHLPPLVATGTLDVEHGSHPVTKPLVKLMNLPRAGRSQTVRLEVTIDGAELIWMRRIGDVSLHTRQGAAGSCIVERSGLGRIVFRLRAEHGNLLYRQTAMTIAGIRVPGIIAPHVDARVSAAPGGWHVDVRVTWRTHLVCRYAGRMAVA